MTSRLDRATGALWGVAIGDALGMPTQSYSRQEIEKLFGPLVTSLHDAPANHPYAQGLHAGQVTDDTEQTVLLAELLIRYEGNVPMEALATMLRSWERSVTARGLRDLLGPSTKRALEQLDAGAPVAEVGLGGTTNGAAMRVAPIAVSAGMDFDLLVHRIVSLSSLTHRSAEALAAAGAVGGCIAGAVAGESPVATVTFATSVMEACAAWGPGDNSAISIFRRALETPAGSIETGDIEEWSQRCGVSVAATASVATAIATVQCVQDDPWRAVCLCASMGDDTDTMASIAGALVGARHGTACFPPDIRLAVAQRNALDMTNVASSLLALAR